VVESLRKQIENINKKIHCRTAAKKAILMAAEDDL
jgi:hypothetical protein